RGPYRAQSAVSVPTLAQRGGAQARFSVCCRKSLGPLRNCNGAAAVVACGSHGSSRRAPAGGVPTDEQQLGRAPLCRVGGPPGCAPPPSAAQALSWNADLCEGDDPNTAGHHPGGRNRPRPRVGSAVITTAADP